MTDMTEQKINSGQTAGTPDQGVHEIHAQEQYRKYKVIDLDNKSIETTAARLVEASKLLNNRDLWVANFKATIEKVREWCTQQCSRISLALVDVRSTKILFYFIPRSERYDLKLGEAMTALEIDLIGSSGIGYVETLQVPGRELDRFVSPDSLLVWNADGE
jgi:hypothetical protein